MKNKKDHQSPIYLLTLLLCLFISCTEKNDTERKTYYDLAGFLNQQITHLNKKSVHKQMQIGEKQETIRANDIDWKKEFELFLQADINKRAYKGSYQTQTKNSTTLYTLKKDEKLPVKYLKITFDKQEKPQIIEAMMATHNYLYQSEKRILMTLKNNEVSSYDVKGWQQLFIGNKKQFEILGKIE